MANIKVLDERNGHFAPNFYEAREKAGVIDVEGTIESNGKGDSALAIVDL